MTIYRPPNTLQWAGGTLCTDEQGGALCTPQACLYRLPPAPSTAGSTPFPASETFPSHQTCPPLLGPSPLPVSPNRDDHGCSPLQKSTYLLGTRSVPLKGVSTNHPATAGFQAGVRPVLCRVETPDCQGGKRAGSYLPGHLCS